MGNLLFKNPEIERNRWAEFSLQRIIAMPVFIVIALAIAYFIGKDQNQYDGITQNYIKVNLGFDYVFIASIGLFLAIVIAWGAKNASDGIIEEYNNRTWDWQRSHNLSPWEMTIGKLFGTTLYNWYGGLFCIGGMLVSWPFIEIYQTGIVLKIIFLILVAILTHASSAITALLAIRKADGRGKVKNGLYVIVLFYAFSSIISPFISTVEGSFSNGYNGSTIDTYWFGLKLSLNLVQFINTSFFTFWAVLGLYRNFKSEYQYINSSWAWISFITYLIINQFGTYIDYSVLGEKYHLNLHENLLFSSLVLIPMMGILAYGTLILEPKNFIYWKKFYEGLLIRNWKQINNYAPLWLISFLGFFLVVLLTILFLPYGDLNTLQIIPGPFKLLVEFGISEEELPLALLSLPLFMLRDFGILLYLHAAPRHKRAMGATIIYLGLLYGAIPGLLTLASKHELLFIFVPIGEYPQWSVVSAAIQAGIIGFLLYKKFINRVQLEN